MSVLGAPGDEVFPVPAAEVAQVVPARGEEQGPLQEHPLVMVVWLDAFFDFDLADPEDSRSDHLVRTVGFLVAEGPRFVSVAQEILPDGDGFRAITHIPNSIVEQITPLHAGPAAVPTVEAG